MEKFSDKQQRPPWNDAKKGEWIPTLRSRSRHVIGNFLVAFLGVDVLDDSSRNAFATSVTWQIVGMLGVPGRSKPAFHYFWRSFRTRCGESNHV